MNFLDCLTELRINAAKELLADPFRSAAEVASMVATRTPVTLPAPLKSAPA